MMQLDDDIIHRHYAEHVEKPFFPSMKKVMTASPVLAMILEGENIIQVIRHIAGHTNPEQATPGSIRADFGLNITHNVIHASDSQESAKREISIFFKSMA